MPQTSDPLEESALLASQTQFAKIKKVEKKVSPKINVKNIQKIESLQNLQVNYILFYVINKGYFTEAFLFKPRGGHSPPSGLNRKPRKNPLFSL